MTPNQVTFASLAVALLAAGCFAAGERSTYVAGAVLLQLSFGLDCADGQLARLTGTFSVLGGWLDAMFDRLKEYVVYAGLAVGSARAGDDVWLLAVLALGLQTVRHILDSAWSVTPAAVSALTEGDRQRAAGRRRRWHWGRKVAILPIAERWLLISVLAAVSSPRIVLAVLVVAGGLAAAYMVAARIHRSLRPTDDGLAPGAAAQLDRMRGAGPAAVALARVVPTHRATPVVLPLAGLVVLAAALVAAVRTGSTVLLLAGAVVFVALAVAGGHRPPDPRWGWAVPPVLGAAEYATVGVAGWVSGAGVDALNYGYLLGVIWHQYDALFRTRHRLGTELSVWAGLGGFEVRILVVAACAAVSASAYTIALAAMTVLLVAFAVARGLDLRKRSRTNQESVEKGKDT